MLSRGTPKLTESGVAFTDAGRTPCNRTPCSRISGGRLRSGGHPSRQEGQRGHTHTHNRDDPLVGKAGDQPISPDHRRKECTDTPPPR